MNYSDTPNLSAPHLTGTVTDTARKLATCTGANLHADTTSIVVAFEGEARFVLNNLTTPTASTGVRVLAGDKVNFSKAEAEALRLIRGGASDVTIQVVQHR